MAETLERSRATIYHVSASTSGAEFTLVGPWPLEGDAARHCAYLDDAWHQIHERVPCEVCAGDAGWRNPEGAPCCPSCYGSWLEGKRVVAGVVGRHLCAETSCTKTWSCGKVACVDNRTLRCLDCDLWRADCDVERTAKDLESAKRGKRYTGRLETELTQARWKLELLQAAKAAEVSQLV